MPNQDPLGTGNRFVFNPRFPGQYADIETGTYYNFFRDYDPTIGRPIGLGGRQFSTYSYVAENPLKYFDPFGLPLIRKTMVTDTTCSYATLSIQSVEISAQDIADVLQIKNGKLREAGQPISLRLPDKIAKHSTWQLSSSLEKNADGISENESIHKHIEHLVKLLELREDAIKQLIPKCDFDIWCFVSFEKSNHGFDLVHDFIHRLSTFPVNLRFDIYGADVD